MLAEIFGLPLEKRAELARQLTSQEKGFLLGIAFSAATKAVREQRIDLVGTGVRSLVFLAMNEDFREILIMLALLDNSCRKLGADISTYIHEASSFFTKETREIFEDYLEAPRGLATMGYVEDVTKEGDFTYKSIW